MLFAFLVLPELRGLLCVLVLIVWLCYLIVPRHISAAVVRHVCALLLRRICELRGSRRIGATGQPATCAVEGHRNLENRSVLVVGCDLWHGRQLFAGINVWVALKHIIVRRCPR